MGQKAWYIGFLLMTGSLKAASQLRLQAPSAVNRFARPAAILPQNFYNQHTGFFCQQEVQWQKTTRLPVYVRLGTKDYVDYLERKPNARTIKK